MSGGRIAGRRLQEIRRRFRQDDPLCAECRKLGKVVAWVHLDHIKAIENGGVDSTHYLENRQGLCIEHHALKTRIDNGWAPHGGADADGWPTDPRHPWNLRKA